MTSSRPARGNAFLGQMFGVPSAVPGPNDLDMQDYRANSLAQPHRFREVLKSGKPIITTCALIASKEICKVLAVGNYDGVFIDAEHTPMGPDLMRDLIHTVNYHSEGSTSALVRLPTHGHEWIAWALDAGAGGVILPHSETAEQAQHAVACARFPPEGHRSYPPYALVPGSNDGLPEGMMLPMEMWSKNGAVIMQIESGEGAKNADAILGVEGVDACMIGNGDLRLSLGLPPGLTGDEPAYTEAITSILSAAKKHNKPVFAFAMGPILEQRIKDGYQGLIVSADGFSLAAGQASILKNTREMLEKHRQGQL